MRAAAAELVAVRQPLLLDEDEALQSAVERIQAELREAAQLGRPVPPVAAVHQDAAALADGLDHEADALRMWCTWPSSPSSRSCCTSRSSSRSFHRPRAAASAGCHASRAEWMLPMSVVELRGVLAVPVVLDLLHALPMRRLPWVATLDRASTMYCRRCCALPPLPLDDRYLPERCEEDEDDEEEEEEEEDDDDDVDEDDDPMPSSTRCRLPPHRYRPLQG